MSEQYSKKSTLAKVGSKCLYFIALVYILYYMVSSLLSSIGLISNGLNSFDAVLLLLMYLIIIATGIFVGLIKFRYETLFIFALLIQIMY